VLFHEFSFLFLFLPLVILAYFSVPERGRNGVLFGFSLIFYSVSSLFYLPILLISTVIDYVLGGAIADAQSPSKKKLFLFLSIASNLTLLGYFKYAGFVSDSLIVLFPEAAIAHLSVTLPVGISFSE
jgi:alginate O-acetyltransferase complex protein AlgI